MKKVTRLIFTASAILLLSLSVITAFADPPDPPPLPGGHGTGGNVTAPIDGGLSILLALGIGYGTRKIYFLRKEKKEKLEA
jgi:hypothetical protein